MSSSEQDHELADIDTSWKILYSHDLQLCCATTEGFIRILKCELQVIAVLVKRTITFHGSLRTRLRIVLRLISSLSRSGTRATM
jgi:hypothetical protein